MKAICHFYLCSFPGLEITIIFHQKANGHCSEKLKRNRCLFRIQQWLLQLIWENGMIFIPTVRNPLATGLHLLRKKLLMEKISCILDRYINLLKLKVVKSLFPLHIQAPD